MSFYGLVWRLLPGPRPAKVAQALVLVAVVVVVLFGWVFPAISPLMPFDETTVGQ